MAYKVLNYSIVNDDLGARYFQDEIVELGKEWAIEALLEINAIQETDEFVTITEEEAIERVALPAEGE